MYTEFTQSTVLDSTYMNVYDYYFSTKLYLLAYAYIAVK